MGQNQHEIATVIVDDPSERQADNLPPEQMGEPYAADPYDPDPYAQM